MFGCSEEVSLNDKTKKLLTSGSWQLQSVKVDGLPSNLYAGLKISFKDGTFTSQNGGSVWPASGSWEFKGSSGTEISRNDGLEISIDQIDEQSVTLSFIWNNTTYNKGNRVAALQGDHVMIFTASN